MKILPDANEKGWTGVTYGEMVEDIIAGESKRPMCKRIFTKVFEILARYELEEMRKWLETPSLFELLSNSKKPIEEDKK